MQNVLLCKDRVSQRNNKDAFLCVSNNNSIKKDKSNDKKRLIVFIIFFQLFLFFSEQNDGFVIGICYLLKLFNLEEKFVLIHWTEEVRRKFTADLKDAQELMAQTADKNISQRKLEEVSKIQIL